MLRKHLRGTQGRPELCVSGFSTYEEPNRPLPSIQPSSAIEETEPIFITFLRSVPLRFIPFRSVALCCIVLRSYSYDVDEALLRPMERGMMHEWTNVEFQAILQEAWFERERGEG